MRAKYDYEEYIRKKYNEQHNDKIEESEAHPNTTTMAWESFFMSAFHSVCRKYDSPMASMFQDECLEDGECCAFNTQCRNGCCSNKGFFCQNPQVYNVSPLSPLKFERCEEWGSFDMDIHSVTIDQQCSEIVRSYRLLKAFRGTFIAHLLLLTCGCCVVSCCIAKLCVRNRN